MAVAPQSHPHSNNTTKSNHPDATDPDAHVHSVTQKSQSPETPDVSSPANAFLFSYPDIPDSTQNQPVPPDDPSPVAAEYSTALYPYAQNPMNEDV
jgi:hypothetical protein